MSGGVVAEMFTANCWPIVPVFPNNNHIGGSDIEIDGACVALACFLNRIGCDSDCSFRWGVVQKLLRGSCLVTNGDCTPHEPNRKLEKHTVYGTQPNRRV
ncbi:hypothetical protein M514_03682 [Trichuris suis]|uniref:Uncharacterized protein n=1 Tax=Trichuris suis TaxID=68888 RepID=A0A085MDP6_9BILA|nr:hypothetical protein M513_03682 [Trichuris suis]KFD68661.1 hypothetical protein M514_03682 [Trichuris suis]